MMRVILMVVGFLMQGSAGLWAVVYAIDILVNSVGGFWAFVLTILAVPLGFIIIFGPWYDLFANGLWTPLIVIYGVFFLGGFLGHTAESICSAQNVEPDNDR